MDDEVKKLIFMAAKAGRAEDAMKFAQAALNAANAMYALASIRGDAK